MAAQTHWPISGEPREWDLKHKDLNTPTVRTVVQSGDMTMGGVAASNPTADDATVIFTDVNGFELWRLNLKAGESDDKEWNLRPTTGLYVQATIAGIHSDVWAWTD
jgi:hypothetical protein